MCPGMRSNCVALCCNFADHCGIGNCHPADHKKCCLCAVIFEGLQDATRIWSERSVVKSDDDFAVFEGAGRFVLDRPIERPARSIDLV